jgi:hypothetical protein
VTTSVRPTPRSHSRWFWLALALFAIAEVNIVAVVPFADVNVGRSAPSHVEAYGTTSHYAHDEAACQLCVARQLVGQLAQFVPLPPPAAAHDEVRSSVTLPAITLDRFSAASPRAPPLQREL